MALPLSFNRQHHLTSTNMSKRKTTKDFIEDAILVHGNKYDYSKVDYQGSREKVCIICPIHGEFWQAPRHHIAGRGCPICKIHTDKKQLPRKPILNIGIYDVPYKISANSKCYEIWVDMLKRCYSSRSLTKNPTYQRCTVCDEWKYFSNFKDWFDKQEYKEGYNLDKDILVQGNKVYSPDTCCFVPQYINKLVLSRVIVKGQYKMGVCKIRDKFVAQCRMRNKNRNLGSYLTEEQAYIAYKRGKEAYIKEVADEAYSKGEIRKEVRNALYRWEIKEE